MTPQGDLFVPADLLPGAYLLVGMSGIVAAANSAFRAQLSLHDEEIVGQPLSALVATEPDKVAEYLHGWSRSGTWSPGGLIFRSPPGQLHRYRADGVRFVPRPGGSAFVLLRLVPCVEAMEPFVRLNRHIADLTQELHRRKRLEMERLGLLARERTAREQAERANHLKDQFLATLSHELRTPLNAVLGWARLLRERGMVTDQGAHGLAVIERNASVQAQLIEDLLDVSRIVTGKLRLDFRSVDLPALIESAIEGVRPAAANKGIRLHAHVDAGATRVTGDAARLEQMVWNLLTNAVKFTPPGGRVSVDVSRTEGHAEISVADTGQGIEPQFLPHVFEAFRQADGGITRKHGGLGLGLALVRAFAEAHGGTIQAASAGAGRGATFTLRLPLYATASPGEPPPSGPPTQLSLAGRHVLVVDDDADARELLALTLEAAGAVPSEAGSVREALRLFGANKPDLLLADIGMPEEDGFSLIRMIRALPEAAGGRVPAIAVTAYAAPKERDDALRAGYDAHVAKPIQPQQLFSAISALTGNLQP